MRQEVLSSYDTVLRSGRRPMTEKLQTILVVDDDERVLRLFEKILVRGGYPVLAATSGRQALQILRDQSVALLILDICMPEPDGFELLTAIRANAPGLRVLAVSGFMGGALLEATRHLGATATLNKADAPQKLLSVVNDLMKW